MKKTAALSLCLFLTGILFTGCASTSAEMGTDGGAAKLTIIGSTSVHPLMEELTAEFKKTNPLKLELQGVGSSAGIKQAKDGTAEIGMSSRPLNTEEQTWGLEETVIALDGIAIVVHPHNPVSNLSKEQAAKIFKGEITNWREVGGPDKNIIVISRESGSGTRGALEEILGLSEKQNGKTFSLTRADALVNNSNGSVKAGVAGKDAAIGYLSLGSLDSSVKSLAIDQVPATEENVKNQTYSVSRPFLLLTKGAPAGEARALIDFILSEEGQKIVSETFVRIR